MPLNKDYLKASDNKIIELRQKRMRYCMQGRNIESWKNKFIPHLILETTVWTFDVNVPLDEWVDFLTATKPSKIIKGNKGNFQRYPQRQSYKSERYS